MSNKVKKTKVEIIYDGDCPFCRNFVMLARLKGNKNNDVHLLNAREHPKLVTEYKAKGFNLNDGMVALVNGKLYYGADAVYMIQLLSQQQSFLQKVVFFAFRWQFLAHLLYPIMKLGRRITLKLLGQKFL